MLLSLINLSCLTLLRYTLNNLSMDLVKGRAATQLGLQMEHYEPSERAYKDCSCSFGPERGGSDKFDFQLVHP